MPTLTDLIPPADLQYVGGGDFVKTGRHFLKIFRTVGALQPHHRVLDVGCGNGRIALPLMEYLNEAGSYEGFDIVKAGIDWCTAKLTPHAPRFRFLHLDTFSASYNVHGRSEGFDCTFPYSDADFDFAFLTSVFTHMLPPDVENYVHELARVLRPGGRCLVTCFLHNEESQRLIDEGRAQLTFRYSGKNYRYDVPPAEDAICFTDSFFLELFRRYGFEPESINPGNWCGRKETLSTHDIVVFVRRPGVQVPRPRVSRSLRLIRLWRRLRTRMLLRARKLFLRREYGWKQHVQRYKAWEEAFGQRS